MTASVLIAGFALSACTERTIESTAKGGLIGGGVGLVAGALYGDPVEGAAHGVVLGAATGAIVSTANELFDDRSRDDRGAYRDDYYSSDRQYEPEYDRRYEPGYDPRYEPGYDPNSNRQGDRRYGAWASDPRFN
jgi:hypothetical protein